MPAAAATTPGTLPLAGELAPQRSWIAHARLFTRRNPIAALGLVVLVLVCAAAVFASRLAPYPPAALNPIDRLEGPSFHHLFGTDAVGHDVFSRTLYGARVSLFVGFSVATISSLIGTALGLCAGLFRSVDLPLMRVMDGFMAFPGLLLALAMIALFGPHLWAVVVVLSAVQTPYTARLMRSAVLSLRHVLYVEAARSIGVGEGRLLLRYILPNVMAPLLVYATFHFSTAVLDEAALSFLGTGIPPSTPTWGNIIGFGRAVVQQAPWLSIFPGLAITVTVLSMSVFGDALRDTLDPVLSRRG